MSSSITRYTSLSKHVADGTINLVSDTFNVVLLTSSYTPSSTTHRVYADLTNELSTANGYTNGGQALTSVSFNQSGTTSTWTAANPSWTATGGSIVAHYAVIYKVGTVGSVVNPLIAYILLDTTPTDVTTTSGNVLTITWNASGIFDIS